MKPEQSKAAPLSPAVAADPAPPEQITTSSTSLDKASASQQDHSAISASKQIATPRLLQILRITAVVATVVFTGCTVLSLWQARSAMTATSRDIEQYGKVQDIQANMLSAHAFATYGLLPAASPDAARQYREKISKAQELIIEAAQDQPADRETLVKVNNAVLDYAASIQLVKTAPKPLSGAAGNPLTQSSALLEQQIVSPLAVLAGENESRAKSHSTTLFLLWIGVIALCSIAALVIVSVLIARRTHRVINPGLLIAVIFIMLATSLAGVLISYVNPVSNSSGDQLTIRSATQARYHAYQAKINENTALVFRNGADVTEPLWEQEHKKAQDNLSALVGKVSSFDLNQSFETYAKAHEVIRERASISDWETASTRAVAVTASDAQPAFENFEKLISATASDAGKRASETLRNSQFGVVISTATIAVASFFVVVAVIAGVGKRLKEYLL